MITYFDTSALIPLLVEEEGSLHAARLWEGSERVVSARLIYPEARAALAMAQRVGRLLDAAHQQAVAGLEDLDRRIDHVEITEGLARRAGHLAHEHALRGYDAVHLASIELVADSDTVVVTLDGALRDASQAIGLATAALGSDGSP